MTDRTSTIFVLAALLFAGCTPSAPGAPAPAAADCVLVDDAASPSITLGVVGAAALRDATPSADVVAAQTYETLVRVDCRDRVIPGLARTWSSSDRLHWRFDLRPGTVFTDGTPANARSVAAALATLPIFAAVTAAGEYELWLTLRSEADVRLFASRAVSVRRMTGSGPAGTGRYVPVFDAAGRVLRLTARGSTAEATTAGGSSNDDMRHGGVDSSHAPDTIIVRASGPDPRAAVDAGVDALVARDAATIEYARARSGYDIVPLTWSRTYVLATAHNPDASTTVPATAFPDAVVGADVRAAEPPYWWSGCGAEPSPGAPAGLTDNRVLYLRDDPVARSIAERITALARGRAPEWLSARLPEGTPIAVAADTAELIDALRARRALAVVVALPREQPGGCAAPSAEQLEPLRAWHVTPLVDARDYLIHRDGIGRITVDADGTLRFGGG